jgi:chemotaxis protein CheX
MKPFFINPFVTAAVNIIKQATGVKVIKRNIYACKGKVSLGGVGIILDINGDLSGKVVYEFSRNMTMQLSSRIIKKSKVYLDEKTHFLKLLKSAIAELGNLISGRAVTYLMENECNCDITPPKFYMGKDVPLVPFFDTTFVIELETDHGYFVINLALEYKHAMAS